MVVISKHSKQTQESDEVNGNNVIYSGYSRNHFSICLHNSLYVLMTNQFK